MTTYTYTTLKDPLALGETSANSINDAGQLVGSYYTGSTYNREFDAERLDRPC